MNNRWQFKILELIIGPFLLQMGGPSLKVYALLFQARPGVPAPDLSSRPTNKSYD